MIYDPHQCDVPIALARRASRFSQGVVGPPPTYAVTENTACDRHCDAFDRVGEGDMTEMLGHARVFVRDGRGTGSRDFTIEDRPTRTDRAPRRWLKLDMQDADAIEIRGGDAKRGGFAVELRSDALDRLITSYVRQLWRHGTREEVLEVSNAFLQLGATMLRKELRRKRTRS